MKSARSIHTQQKLWGEETGIALHATRGDYCARPEDNLPWLTDEVRQDFLAGDGREFDTKRGWAKIAALHSSSALAANLFSYWTRQDPDALRRAMNLPSQVKRVRFEQKFPTGVGSRSPNIDVVLFLSDGSIRAVESKFAEMFRPSGQKTISPKYFPNGRALWATAGLPGAQKAAAALALRNPYQFLDAAQLLKHMLGLANGESEWQLQLVWFETGDEESEAVTKEIESFSSSLGKDTERFSATTYQQLWSTLAKDLDRTHARYVEYMQGRYFSTDRD